uniref:Alpha/beta hydrolase fold-3 domain-containing protein n=1 Tax=Nelumbo nucifera TaxID=4432 RepID=A0A822YXY1_NELNU|nr:TPA_asm: hypothetical protein HUJ06_007704 [Nelumbo nucifera]
MAVQLSATDSGINPYGFLRIVLHPDGTLTRLDAYATVDDGTTEQNSAVLTKDITLDPTKKTWLRIFRPRQLPPSFSSSSEKLPLVVYFHGGGFIVGGANWKMFHDLCVSMAVEFPALVVSVGYRLAPEHRLPTAYEDSVEALHWIKNQASSDGMNSEEWLRDLADFSRCFLVGTSAGGNIAFHVGLRALEVARELEPIKITGLILHDPFFGASERTKSELKLANDPILPLAATDLMWNLSLPKGFDRDHVYCNPMKLEWGLVDRRSAGIHKVVGKRGCLCGAFLTGRRLPCSGDL